MTPGEAALSCTPIGQVQPRQRVAVCGTIKSPAALSIGGTPACRYTLQDETGQLDLLFLGRVEVHGLERGKRCKAEGMVAIRDGRAVMWNPRYRIESPDSATRPANGVGPPQDLGAEPVAADARGGPGRVLVVDDDPGIRRVLQLTFLALGYQVDLAASGAGAIELAGRRPDLIILDIGLPDVSGLSAIAAIHRACDAPIIVMSAREVVAAKAAALAAGATEYLPKPFAVDALLAKVRMLDSAGRVTESHRQGLAGAGVAVRG